MTPSTTCGVCGTVNVLATGRCIACSQPLEALDLTEDLPASAQGAPGGPAAPALDAKTAPLEEGAYAAAAARVAPAAPAAPSPPAPAAAPPAPPIAVPAPAMRPAPAVREPMPPTDDLGGAALRRTVVEPAARRPRQPEPEPEPERPVTAPESRNEMQFDPGRAPAEGAPAAPATPTAHRPAARGKRSDAAFVLRLLLPEGDKRLVEMGDRPVKLGSGLDEVGLPGDPRVRPSEATLEIVDGQLWIDVAPDACGVYRRVDGEEPLHDGDVVLVGDIAARFSAVPEAVPVSGDTQVLGGAAGNPCGRLTFLRRDGSAGPVHDLPQGKTILGRTDGHLNFPSDSRLSRRHARFFASPERVTIEDLDSRNGTYLRLRGRRRLESGDALRVGSAGLQIRHPG